MSSPDYNHIRSYFHPSLLLCVCYILWHCNNFLQVSQCSCMNMRDNLLRDLINSISVSLLVSLAHTVAVAIYVPMLEGFDPSSDWIYRSLLWCRLQLWPFSFSLLQLRVPFSSQVIPLLSID